MLVPGALLHQRGVGMPNFADGCHNGSAGESTHLRSRMVMRPPIVMLSQPIRDAAVRQGLSPTDGQLIRMLVPAEVSWI
jgi:hypothetical protein